MAEGGWRPFASCRLDSHFHMLLCLGFVLLGDTLAVLKDMVLLMFSMRNPDDSAMDTFHCDTAMLLWGMILHFELLYPKVSFESAVGL